MRVSVLVLAVPVVACAPYLGRPGASGQREVLDREASAPELPPVQPQPLGVRARAESAAAIRVEVRNPGAVAARLPRPIEPYFRVERLEASRWVSCVPAALPDRVEFFDLGPGESVEARLDVAGRCPFSELQPRRVAVTLDVPPGTDEYRDAPAAWTGRTQRAVVDLERSAP